ncbi:MAG: hypothetical protein ACC656_12560, partial [Candidatus Heimdallarchaeota archaeon]
MKTQFDLSKLTYGINQYIYFYSLNEKRAYSSRAFGFQSVSVDNELFFIQRESSILTEPELEVLAFSLFLSIAESLEKSLTYYIYFNSTRTYQILDNLPTDLSVAGSSYVKHCITQMNIIYRRGGFFDVSVYSNPPIRLLKKVKKAITGFELVNDFQLNTQLLSCVSSQHLDELLLNFETPFRLIEYVGTETKGIPGIEKYFITPEDEAIMNPIVEDIKIAGHIFPPKSKEQLSLVRRMAMIVRDCDIAILISPFCADNQFFYLENLFIKLTNVYNKDIYMFDSETMKWY